MKKKVNGDVEELIEYLGELDSLLIKKYRNKPLLFWSELQCFHDNDYNWKENETGGFDLTSMGKERYKILLNEFKE